MSKKEVSRRDVLVGTGAVASTLIASNAVLADGHGHSHHDHKSHGGHSSLFSAASDCVTKGQACLDHCLVLFQEKDLSVADCAAQVNLMLPMCETMAKYASTNSKYVKEVAAICMEVCKDCEKECRKHEAHHAECKACADSCASVIKEIKAFMAA